MGQPQAVRILQKVLKDRKTAHAYLFSGIKGVGKTSCAISLTQVLNCEEGLEDGCGRCPACRKIMHLNFLDFRKIEPGGAGHRIIIDTIRSLRREIYLNPVEGKYKVFLITDADRMNEESSNALLKVLEEPPEKSILILTTSLPHLLLPTIVSRCQIIYFRRLNQKEVIEVLRSRPGISEKEIKFVSVLSEGSPGKALSILERGLEERAEIISWLKEYNLNVENIFSIAEKISVRSDVRREKIGWFLEVVLSWYRDIFMIVSGNPSLINQDCAEELKKQAGSLSYAMVQDALKAVLRTQEWINIGANPRLALEVMLLNLKRGEL